MTAYATGHAMALALAALAGAIWLYLLFGRGAFWRHAPHLVTRPPARWPAVVAVIPARDEADGIATCVRSLLSQVYAGRFGLVLVDDHSTDGTAEIARATAAALGAAERLRIVGGRALPPGWTGKLWAVAQGIEAVQDWMPEAELVLFSDADIAHDPGNLAELVAHAEAGGLDLVSLMVALHCATPAERWLIPAFVFFFEMLYPFAWVNRRDRRTAAAAGGCMLARRSALARIGGVASIRGALIDDCALAAAIKPGGPIWLGLATRTRSLRVYAKVGDIWLMVARTAYVQLGHSPLLLGLTVLGMAITYLAPPLLLLAGGLPALLGGLAWIAMAVAYAPTLRRYRRSLLWAPLLPLVALFYSAATIGSAWRHYRGRGGAWKGRVYAKGDA
jgi:hopene-associated glycosyltransferase HpnB